MEVTLKELVNAFYAERPSDLQLIKQYFIKNNLEEEAIQMIVDLSKAQIGKFKRRLESIEMLASWLPVSYLFDNYDKKTAINLMDLELDYLTTGYETNEYKLSDQRFRWAKENIPNIKEPEAYLNALIDYLEQNEIKFKERKEVDVDEENLG